MQPPPTPRAQLTTVPVLDCSQGNTTRCPCWTDATNGTTWPGGAKLVAEGRMLVLVSLSVNQGRALRLEAAAQAKAGRATNVTVEARRLPYRRMSGTSMAT